MRTVSLLRPLARFGVGLIGVMATFICGCGSGGAEFGDLGPNTEQTTDVQGKGAVAGTSHTKSATGRAHLLLQLAVTDSGFKQTHATRTATAMPKQRGTTWRLRQWRFKATDGDGRVTVEGGLNDPTRVTVPPSAPGSDTIERSAVAKVDPAFAIRVPLDVAKVTFYARTKDSTNEANVQDAGYRLLGSVAVQPPERKP